MELNHVVRWDLVSVLLHKEPCWRSLQARLIDMLDRAFRLSSNWSYFSEECDRLKIVFSRLDYPDKLVNSTITRFMIADKASDQPTSRLPTATNMQDPVRLVLPFKRPGLCWYCTNTTEWSESENSQNHPACVCQPEDQSTPEITRSQTAACKPTIPCLPI